MGTASILRMAPLRLWGVAAEVDQPSFVVTDPHHRFLYAVTEIGSGGKGEGFVSSFAIDAKTGALTFLNKVPSLGGGPCHMVVDKTNRMLFVANYGTGSVAAFALKSDGSIGDKTAFDQLSGSSIDARRQKGPHAHEVVLSSDNRFLFVPDLGVDHIKIYKVDAAARTFTPNDPAFVAVKPGLGPRHFAFGPASVLVICSARWDRASLFSRMTRRKESSLRSKPFRTCLRISPAKITLRRYRSVLQDALCMPRTVATTALRCTLSIRQKALFLRYRSCHQEERFHVTSFSILLEKYLIVANQKSDSMVIFDVDQKTGKLTPTGRETSVSSPVSIQFVPAPLATLEQSQSVSYRVTILSLFPALSSRRRLIS